MKKHISLRMMVPLLLLFLLTVIVNMTTTSKLQEVRATCKTIQEISGDSETAGMAEDTAAGLSSSLATNGILSSLQLLTVVVVIFITYFTIVKPLKKIKVQLDNLIGKLEHDEGDLSERIVTNGKDEIGTLVGGINLVLDKLQLIVRKINTHSESLGHSSNNIMTMVTDSTKDSEEVSSQTSELVGEVSTIADSVTDIVSEMNVLSDNSNSISDIASSGKSYVDEMKGRANNIKRMVGESKNNSERITEALKKDLEESVEHSKNVSSINMLTEEILSIASQTNLLALNASIEAARAGEVGKGFAVVADEIRALADNSRNTANSIQQISNEVISSVESLSDASDKLLNFVTTDVLKDYDKFVDVTEEYLNDADALDNMMVSFAGRSKSLAQATDVMNRKITDISSAIDRETSRISALSDTISGLTGNMSEIQNYTTINDDVSNDLKKEIQKFRAI